MVMPGLKCTVDTCHFWSSGNHCSASEIEVNHTNDHAHTSDDTVCKTFRPTH